MRENSPASGKGKDAASVTEFQQPAFPVGVEEGVRQVIAVVVGDFKRLAVDALIEFLKGKSSPVKGAGVRWAWRDSSPASMLIRFRPRTVRCFRNKTSALFPHVHRVRKQG